MVPSCEGSNPSTPILNSKRFDIFIFIFKNPLPLNNLWESGLLKNFNKIFTPLLFIICLNNSVLFSNEESAKGFLKGTPVLMADLEYKNIEEIKEEDLVLGFDFKKQSFTPTKVTKTWTQQTKFLGKVFLSEDCFIEAAPDQQFYLPVEWVFAPLKFFGAYRGTPLMSWPTRRVNLLRTEGSENYNSVTYNLKTETENYLVSEYNILTHNDPSAAIILANPIAAETMLSVIAAHPVVTGIIVAGVVGCIVIPELKKQFDGYYRRTQVEVSPEVNENRARGESSPPIFRLRENSFFNREHSYFKSDFNLEKMIIEEASHYKDPSLISNPVFKIQDLNNNKTSFQHYISAKEQYLTKLGNFYNNKPTPPGYLYYKESDDGQHRFSIQLSIKPRRQDYSPYFNYEEEVYFKRIEAILQAVYDQSERLRLCVEKLLSDNKNLSSYTIKKLNDVLGSIAFLQSGYLNKPEYESVYDPIESIKHLEERTQNILKEEEEIINSEFIEQPINITQPPQKFGPFEKVEGFRVYTDALDNHWISIGPKKNAPYKSWHVFNRFGEGIMHSLTDQTFAWISKDTPPKEYECLFSNPQQNPMNLSCPPISAKHSFRQRTITIAKDGLSQYWISWPYPVASNWMIYSRSFEIVGAVSFEGDEKIRWVANNPPLLPYFCQDETWNINSQKTSFKKDSIQFTEYLDDNSLFVSIPNIGVVSTNECASFFNFIGDFLEEYLPAYELINKVAQEHPVAALKIAGSKTLSKDEVKNLLELLQKKDPNDNDDDNENNYDNNNNKPPKKPRRNRLALLLCSLDDPRKRKIILPILDTMLKAGKIGINKIAATVAGVLALVSGMTSDGITQLSSVFGEEMAKTIAPLMLIAAASYSIVSQAYENRTKENISSLKDMNNSLIVKASKADKKLSLTEQRAYFEENRAIKAEEQVKKAEDRAIKAEELAANAVKTAQQLLDESIKLTQKVKDVSDNYEELKRDLETLLNQNCLTQSPDAQLGIKKVAKRIIEKLDLKKKPRVEDLEKMQNDLAENTIALLSFRQKNQENSSNPI